MTDEMFDISSIQSQFKSRRGSKTKYNTRIWEATDPKGKAKYALRMAQNWDRRKAAGKVDGDENPYEGLVSEKMRYEIEMETVFHVDPESVVSSDDDSTIETDVTPDEYIIVPDEINDIVNVKYDDFVVMSDFYYDNKLGKVVAKVPVGVVTTKMCITDIRAKFVEITSQNKFKNMKDLDKKYRLLHWLDEAETFIDEYGLDFS